MLRFHHARFAAVSLATLLLIGCAVGPKAKHDRALTRAKEMIQKGDFARALLECRTAIQVMPKDPEGYYELGLAYAGAHDLQNAAYSFQKTLALKPNHVGAQVQLAAMMASTSNRGNLEDAEGRMNQVLKVDPKNTEALDTLALTQLKLGNTDTAIEDLNRALSTAPGSLRTSILLAQAKISQKDLKGAETVLKSAVRNNPRSADALVILAFFYVAQHRMPEAEDALNQAITKYPQDAAALFSLAKLKWRAGKRDDADELFRRLSALPDKQYRTVYGQVLLVEGKRDQSVREFERLFKADAGDRELRTRLVAAYWGVGRRADAENVLNAALEKNANDTDALLQRAQMFILTAQYGKAESDLNTVLHLTPNSAEAHYALAQVHQGRGNALQQRQELSEALRLKPALLGVRISLANLLTATNGASSALQVLDAAPENQRQSLAILIARNWALMGAGQLPEARKSIDTGLKQGKQPDLLLQDGLLKLQQGNVAGGRAALDEELKANGTDVRALRAMYASYVQQKQNGAGLERVSDYARRAPQSPAVQSFLGEILMANGKNAEARSAFLAARAIDPKADSVNLALVKLDLADHKLEDARKGLEARLQANSNDTVARLWLANLDEEGGDHAAALKGYRQVVDADPRNAQALNNLAYLLVDYKHEPDEALHFAQKAQEISPSDPNYADTVGLILYRKGLYSLAAKNFAEAASKPGAAPVCNYHLAMAYAKLGDREHGIAALNVALRRDPKLPEAGEASQMLR